MEIIQILLIIFALFAWSRVIINYRKKRLSTNEFVFWSLVWILVVVVSIIPDIVSNFAKVIGIQTGMNLLIYASIIVLFYLIYRLYVKIENINNEMTKLVRRIAILNKGKQR